MKTSRKMSQSEKQKIRSMTSPIITETEQPPPKEEDVICESELEEEEQPDTKCGFIQINSSYEQAQVNLIDGNDDAIEDNVFPPTDDDDERS